MTLLIIIIILAIIFDYVNGFHDAANAITSIVTTKVLTPVQAVLWATLFNFVAYFVARFIIGEFGIANTIAKVVYESFITLPIILAGISAALFWNLFTWWFGIPSSSSHALIGGFAGAAICASQGFSSIHSQTILLIVSFIVIAPTMGLVVSSLVTILIQWIFRKTEIKKARSIFKYLQLGSSALFSIGHGLNDSQKVMGIIAVAMIAATKSNDGMPHWLSMNGMHEIHDWVAIVCFSAISLGTMSGGWKIVKTMGNKITKITTLEGVCADTAGALTLFFTEILKVPVSTTHTITGAIMGVGAAKRFSAVRWKVSLRLIWAWVLTIPVSASLAALFYIILGWFGIN